MTDPAAPFAERLRALRAEPSRDVPGDPARLRRVAFTRAEMAAQPEAIRETLAQEDDAINALAARIRARRFDHTVIVGCGDSWFVGMGVRHAIETLTGRPVIAAQALDFAAYDAVGTGAGGLVLGISAGGNTPAVMAALRAAQERGAMTIGLSNTTGSPILTDFDAGLRIHATRRGWPTQSSTAAMALLIQLALRATPDAAAHRTLSAALAGTPDLVARTYAETDAPMRLFAERIARAGCVFFAGAGPHFATASFGAAKIRELAPIHAAAFPLEELQHYRLPKKGDPLVVIAPDPATRERALDAAIVAEAEGAFSCLLLSEPDPDIEALAGQVVRVPACNPALAPIIHAPALHALAYHVAIARDALGLGLAESWTRS